MWSIQHESWSCCYRNNNVFLCICQCSEDVKALLTALTSDKGLEASTAAYDQYTANWGSKPGKDDIKKTIVEIETDYTFLVPTQTALYLHAKHAKCVNHYHYQSKWNLQVSSGLKSCSSTSWRVDMLSNLTCFQRAWFQHKAFLDSIISDLVNQNDLDDFKPLQSCDLYSALINLVLFSFQDGPYLFVPVLRAQPHAFLSQLDGGWPCWRPAVCVWKAFHHSPGLLSQTS